MRTSIATGFGGVDIFENDFVAFDGSPRDVGALVKDNGLEMSPASP